MLCGRFGYGDEHGNRVAAVGRGWMLQLTVEEPAPGVRVLTVSGELDILTAPTLEHSIQRQLACDLRGLIIDLTEVSFLACAGLHVLDRAGGTAQRRNVSVRLVCNSPTLLRVLAICDTRDRFAVSPTLGNALDDALGVAPPPTSQAGPTTTLRGGSGRSRRSGGDQERDRHPPRYAVDDLPTIIMGVTGTPADPHR